MLRSGKTVILLQQWGKKQEQSDGQTGWEKDNRLGRLSEPFYLGVQLND